MSIKIRSFFSRDEAELLVDLIDERNRSIYPDTRIDQAADDLRSEFGMVSKERQYKEFGMPFGQAIEAMKRGAKVARKGWNGKGMYLWLLPAAKIPADWCKEPHLKALAEANGGSYEALGSIRMKTADNKVLTGWLASQTDMLAEDWRIVDVP